MSVGISAVKGNVGKRKDAMAAAIRAADKEVKQARLDLENWMLTNDLAEIARKRAKLGRKMAHAAKLRRKFGQ